MYSRTKITRFLLSLARIASTVRHHYNTVNFLQYSLKAHQSLPVRARYGWCDFCISLWFIFCPRNCSTRCMQYLVILDHVTMALNCMCNDWWSMLLGEMQHFEAAAKGTLVSLETSYIILVSTSPITKTLHGHLTNFNSHYSMICEMASHSSHVYKTFRERQHSRPAEIRKC